MQISHDNLFFVCSLWRLQNTQQHQQQTHPWNCRKPKTDPSLNVGETKPLDSSVQKHKLAVKPKKRHASSAHRNSSINTKSYTPKPGER